MSRDPQTGVQIRIGVMGSADTAAGEVVTRCRDLGRAVAEAGCCLLTGACRGLPHEAVVGAKKADGHVVGRVEGHAVAVGNLRLMQDLGVAVEALWAQGDALREDGQTVMFVAADGRAAGLVGVADPTKGRRVASSRRCRARGGASRWRATGSTTRRRWRKPTSASPWAPARTWRSRAPGSRWSRGMRNIRENLFFAFIYNALGVPIAAGVLYPVAGILLSPIIATRR